MRNNNIGISGFLDRYKDFSKRMERHRIIHYKTNFDGLLKGYNSLKNRIDSRNKKEAIDFNIFQILHIETKEVQTHTPFLKNLLSPAGTHGQGDLFLRSFIQKFIPKKKRACFGLNNYHDYNVVEEKHTLHGRIDIYIYSLDPKKKFGIIIENKLFAHDQNRQLERYYDFLTKDKQFDTQEMMIFYLTIDGRDPTPDSIDKKSLKSLKDNNEFRSISYNEDIKNWLKDIILKVQADKVKYSIYQYLNIIDNLER